MLDTLSVVISPMMAPVRSLLSTLPAPVHSYRASAQSDALRARFLDRSGNARRSRHPDASKFCRHQGLEEGIVCLALHIHDVGGVGVPTKSSLWSLVSSVSCISPLYGWLSPAPLTYWQTGAPGNGGFFPTMRRTVVRDLLSRFLVFFLPESDPGTLFL